MLKGVQIGFLNGQGIEGNEEINGDVEGIIRYKCHHLKSKLMKKRFFTVTEIAIYLGFSVSAIRKWVRLGGIPFCRINGGIRFDLQEIDKWTHKNRVSF